MLYDVITTGSGPARYTTAAYVSRAALKALIVTGPAGYSGILMNTTLMENYPDFKDGIQRPDPMEGVRGQAQCFGAEMIYEDATTLGLAGDVRTVTIDDATYQVRAVIITTGSGCHTPGAPGEAEYPDHGVSYCTACDGFFSRGQPAMMAGGGGSAVEEATYSTNFGFPMTLVHRRERSRASKAIQQKAPFDPKIQFKLNRVMDSINGTGKAEAVTLRNMMTGETETVEVGGLFIVAGHISRTKLVRNQLCLDDLGNTWVDSPTTKTSLSGVSTVDNVTDALYRQVVASAGTGCKAATDAKRYLRDLGA